MLFVAPVGRARHQTLGMAAVAGAIPWLPFVLADPRTLLHLNAADSPTSDSIWGTLGLLDHGHPASVRILQSTVCLLAGFLAYRWRGVSAALVVVGLARVALDVATWSYMFLLLMTAGIVADLLRDRGPRLRPVSTLSCSLVLLAPLLAGSDPAGRCILRTVAILAVLGLHLWPEPSARAGRRLAQLLRSIIDRRRPEEAAPVSAG